MSSCSRSILLSPSLFSPDWCCERIGFASLSLVFFAPSFERLSVFAFGPESTDSQIWSRSCSAKAVLMWKSLPVDRGFKILQGLVLSIFLGRKLYMSHFSTNFCCYSTDCSVKYTKPLICGARKHRFVPRPMDLLSLPSSVWFHPCRSFV